MTLRNLARIGVTGSLAVGALSLAAAPAFAADVDFGVTMTGTTIAADSSGKFAKLTVANHGTKKPAAVEVTFDLSKLDTSKVTAYDLDTGSFCGEEKPGQLSCWLDDEFIPAAGGSTDLDLPLRKVAGAAGAAGKITMKVVVKGDTNKANDSKTVDVTVGDNGADLSVYAPDVTAADGETGEPTGKPIAPGALGSLAAAVFNDGDMSAAGVKLEVKLPKQTSFAVTVDGCAQSADKRTLTCNFQDRVLIPVDKTGQPGEASGLGVLLPVRVSADAKGPVSLKGGSVTATAIKQVDYSASKAKAAPALPQGFVPLGAADRAKIDADLSDNTDGFAVLVAASAGGGTGGPGTGGPGTGGPGAGGPGNGGGEGGGGLPVTGPAAFAIGAGGLAAVALGLVLFVAARRRRVVLVTPGDEK